MTKFEKWADETIDWGNVTYSRRKIAEQAFKSAYNTAIEDAIRVIITAQVDGDEFIADRVRELELK